MEHLLLGVMSRAEALLMFFENGRENLLNQLLLPNPARPINPQPRRSIVEVRGLGLPSLRAYSSKPAWDGEPKRSNAPN